MEVDHGLLKKYWLGQCSPEERQRVEAWIASGTPPDRDQALRTVQNEATMKSVLWQRITQQSQLDDAPAPNIKSPFYKQTLIKVAASIIFLMGIGSYLWTHQDLFTPQKDSVPYKTVTVAKGKQMQVILSDGSKVYLHAGSTLQYPVHFSKEQRHVILQGEGFFDIQQNPAQPFQVEAGEIQIRVLGTQFNVNSRKPGKEVVTVETGKVQVSAIGATDTLTLSAGMQGQHIAGSLQEKKVNSQHYSGWKNGQLRFDHIPLAEVALELERWYDTDVKITDAALANTKVRAHFKNATLKEVVHDIAFALHIQYKIKNKEVLFIK